MKMAIEMDKTKTKTKKKMKTGLEDFNVLISIKKLKLEKPSIANKELGRYVREA